MDEKSVEEALVKVVSALKVFVLVKIFVLYVFGMVVDASTKLIALVVENARPTDAKYSAEVVENAFAR